MACAGQELKDYHLFTNDSETFYIPACGSQSVMEGNSTIGMEIGQWLQHQKQSRQDSDKRPWLSEFLNLSIWILGKQKLQYLWHMEAAVAQLECLAGCVIQVGLPKQMFLENFEWDYYRQLTWINFCYLVALIFHGEFRLFFTNKGGLKKIPWTANCPKNLHVKNEVILWPLTSSKIIVLVAQPFFRQTVGHLPEQ